MAEEVRFVAIGDAGHSTVSLKNTAALMDRWIRANGGSVDFVLHCGDNFYPNGVDNVDDDKFNSVFRDIYLAKYETLRVPFYVVLGNHDYMGNPEAQIKYTDCKHNNPKIWNMPAKNYRVPIPSRPDIALYALDTNGVQFSVRRKRPETQKELYGSISKLSHQLETENSENNARFCMVFAHHPMFTNGKGHKLGADCLREESYELPDGSMAPGYDLKRVLEGQCDAYITGHEHVLSVHTTNTSSKAQETDKDKDDDGDGDGDDDNDGDQGGKASGSKVPSTEQQQEHHPKQEAREGGAGASAGRPLHHFVVGSSGGSVPGFYQGQQDTQVVDWFSKHVGFLYCRIGGTEAEFVFVGHKARMHEVQFPSSLEALEHAHVLRRVRVPLRPAQPSN